MPVKTKERRLRGLFREIERGWGRVHKGSGHKRDGKPLVYGSGPANARVMVIGEAPGRDETRQGTPFVGRAGGFFVEILEDVFKMKRGDFYITNVVKVWPTIETKRLKTRPPHDDEVGFFLPCLGKEVKIVSPKAIIAAGKTAFKALFPSEDFTPYKWFRSEGGVPVMPVYHPAYILRKQKEIKKNLSVLKTALKKVRSMVLRDC